MKTAEDIMSRNVITVALGTTVQDLARTLLAHNISGVPVVDDDNTLVGIATESDLIFQNKKLQVPAVIAILDSFLFLNNPDKMEKELKKIAGATVGEICTRDVVSVRPDTSLDEIATIMSEKKIHTLPVVSPAGEMVGVVGKKDIIRTIL